MNLRFTLPPNRLARSPHRVRTVLIALVLPLVAACAAFADLPVAPVPPVILPGVNATPAIAGPLIGPPAGVAEPVPQVSGPASKGPRLPFREMLRQASPGYLWNTARTNWREGRFYSTDLKGPGPGNTHPTWQAAMKRSLAPVDMRANVGAAVLNRVHPFKIAGNLIDPIGIELQRQLASGEGLNWGRLATALHPILIGTTFVAGTAGDIAGAVVQSSLARFGPVGAAVGFFARPMLGFAGSVFGMSVGENMVRGGATFKGGIAQALRSIKPGRDGGQMVGGVIGATLGQVFIPIPVVGGIIGGMIGGTAGALLGNWMSKRGPFKFLEKSITSYLGRLADKLERDDTKKQAAPAQAPPPGPVTAPALGPTTASSTSATPASPGPQSRGEFANPLRSNEPTLADLPMTAR